MTSVEKFIEVRNKPLIGEDIGLVISGNSILTCLLNTSITVNKAFMIARQAIVEWDSIRFRLHLRNSAGN